MTSVQKWTPKYTRLQAIAAASGSAQSAARGTRRESATAAPNEVVAWPDGNEAVSGSSTSAMPVGRSRSTTSLRSVEASEESPRATATVSAVQGARRCATSVARAARTNSARGHHSESAMKSSSVSPSG
jgi:hypothetical protein